MDEEVAVWRQEACAALAEIFGPESEERAGLEQIAFDPPEMGTSRVRTRLRTYPISLKAMMTAAK